MSKVLTLGAANVAEGLRRLGVEAVCVEKFPEKISSDFYSGLEEYSAVFFSSDFAVSDYCDDKEDVFGHVCVRCAMLEIPMIFDPNLKSIKPEQYAIIEGLAYMTDIFLPSKEDAKALCGSDDPEEIARHYLDWGTKKVVLKLDKKGAYFRSAKESGYAPTFRADNVVDTQGAGDAFAAGLISGIIEEIPLSEAVIRANACGCIAIQKEGINDCFPTSDKLREYMLNHRFAVDGCKEF